MALMMNVEIETLYRSDSDLSDTFLQKRKIENAYIKIDEISGGKEKLRTDVVFYEKEGGNIVQRRGYSFTPSVADDSENFIRQGYEYLKTLPEFAGAVDC